MGFPLPMNRKDGFLPAVPSFGGWKAAVPGSGAQGTIEVRGGLSSVLSPLVPRRERKKYSASRLSSFRNAPEEV